MAKIRYRSGGSVNTLFDNGTRMLWSGASFMTETQTINLSQKVSAQNNGICLVWSEYVDGVGQDYGFITTFVPKGHIANNPGLGLVCTGSVSVMSYFMSKYVYISDGFIKGHAQNDSDEITGYSGVKYKNNRFVLRKVYGV